MNGLTKAFDSLASQSAHRNEIIVAVTTNNRSSFVDEVNGTEAAAAAASVPLRELDPNLQPLCRLHGQIFCKGCINNTKADDRLFSGDFQGFYGLFYGLF